MKRSATANWKGSGKEGKGTVSADSGVFSAAAISWRTRFQDAEGTSPEELVAAAHAGCFSMKLSFNLEGAGFTPDQLETTCEINFENGVLTESHLILKATVKGIDQAKFDELVKHAEENCPISKTLSIKITVDATLNS